MSKALESIPGVTFSFQQPIQMRFNELMTGAKQDVVIKIYGENLEMLTQYANKIGKLSASVKGALDLYVEQVNGLSQIVIKFDRDKIAQFGLNIEDVNRVIKQDLQEKVQVLFTKAKNDSIWWFDWKRKIVKASMI